MTARAGAWLGLSLLLLSGVCVLCGAVTVFHRQERCVQGVKAAQGASLSTWEAVERCQR
jgi:hypothetical protein